MGAVVGDHRYQEEERRGGAALFIHATTYSVDVVGAAHSGDVNFLPQQLDDG